MHNLIRSAIQAALKSQWETAINLNLEILSLNPKNIAALTRLAHAYTELDQKKSAREIYEQVLALDRYNDIATKGIRSLPDRPPKSIYQQVEEDFIEEPGVTRIVKLVKLASKSTLLSLVCKEPLILAVRPRLISITRSDQTYIGSLPDDLSLHLRHLLSSGYNFQVCIKYFSDNSVTIFLRETKRPNRKNALPAFPRSSHLKT